HPETDQLASKGVAHRESTFPKGPSQLDIVKNVASYRFVTAHVGIIASRADHAGAESSRRVPFAGHEIPKRSDHYEIEYQREALVEAFHSVVRLDGNQAAFELLKVDDGAESFRREFYVRIQEDQGLSGGIEVAVPAGPGLAYPSRRRVG